MDRLTLTTRFARASNCLRAIFFAVAFGVAAVASAQTAPAPSDVAPEDDPATSPTMAMSGLTAKEVAVVANFNMPASVDLAKHYMEVRGIPAKQLLVTGMPTSELTSRNEYERLIAGPLRDFLVQEKLDQIRCVVLIYGVPLKVLEPITTPDIEQMSRMISEARESRLEIMLRLPARLAALTPSSGLSTTETLALDTAKPVAEQLRLAGPAAIEAFRKSALAISAVKAKDQRAKMTDGWMELWKTAFGASPPPQGAVDVPPPSPAQIKALTGQLLDLRNELQKDLDAKDLAVLLDHLEKARGAAGLLETIDGIERRVKPDPSWRAAVDSELSTLFWPSFPLARYVQNPLQSDYHGPPPPRTLMVCRLDGPDEAAVRKMIDDSVAVEKTGLSGNAYIDARGRTGEGPYADCDLDLVHLAKLLQQHTKIKTTLDQREELFQPGDCPDAALYCGWYSYGKYIDAFKFVRGAVAYHIASAEAVTLRDRKSTVWCPQLIAHGVVATLGPVEEPYLTAFPHPSSFFGLLLTGRYTLIESYYLTLPHLSWMMTLIGDPLYNPYAAHPALADPALIDDAP